MGARTPSEGSAQRTAISPVTGASSQRWVRQRRGLHGSPRSQSASVSHATRGSVVDEPTDTVVEVVVAVVDVVVEVVEVVGGEEAGAEGGGVGGAGRRGRGGRRGGGGRRGRRGGGYGGRRRGRRGRSRGAGRRRGGGGGGRRRPQIAELDAQQGRVRALPGRIRHRVGAVGGDRQGVEARA